ncbi:MAG TPA: hypothetical protein VNF51_00510 [Candidatus Paceibacterota bacterium]|nr:hypothetical protein [Candidatus Paceibacterota bacterium]
MNKSVVMWTVLAVIVIAGGWYWLSMSQTSSAIIAPTQTVATQPTAVVSSTTPVLNVHSDPTLGTYLVAANGMTLYVDTKDTNGVSTCTGVCAANWPPYIVNNEPTFTGGVGVSGAITVISDTMQLTYKGMPLYFWIKDTKVGDATGNKIGNFVLAKP